LVGMATVSPCCIPALPTRASYTKAITLSIPPGIVPYVLSLDLFGTDNLLAADRNAHS
jgi:hypothetical protein